MENNLDLKQEPEMVDDSELEDITKFLNLKAFIRFDEVMGKHLVLYVDKDGKQETAVGVNVHPLVSKKLLQSLRESGIVD